MTGFESWVYYRSIEIMSPIITIIMKCITRIGDAIPVMVICLVLFSSTRLRKKYAVPVLLTVTLSAFINIILKNIFVRERPNILRLIDITGYSFPSGHAMTNMALYSMISVLSFKYIKDVRIKTSIIIFCTAIIILIGFSRIYLGVHYITDVLAGWCIGFLITVIIYYCWNRKMSKG